MRGIETGFTGDGLTPSTTAVQMLADLMIIAFYIRGATKQVHGGAGLRMLLGTDGYTAIASKVYSEYTGESVLSTFLKTQKLVTEVESWEQRDLADEQGDGERLTHGRLLSCLLRRACRCRRRGRRRSCRGG